jgi:hypothetical protein
MPLNLLLKIKRAPTDLRKKQLLNDYKYWNGIFVQTKDPEKKRRIGRTGYSIQLQMINWGIHLRRPAKWNNSVQWKYLVGRMRRYKSKDEKSSD